MDKWRHSKGIVMVTIGAALWGISGTMAGRLFQYNAVSTEWLVTVRLLCSGGLFLLLALMNKESRGQVLAIWKNKRDALNIFLFGFVGMLGVQYTYFASIATGNAAVATLLQYLAPFFITLYLVMKNRSFPTRKEIFAVFLALFGTFLLMTNGTIKGFSVSGVSIMWGILSGVTLAFYTLHSSHFIQRYRPSVIIGWGMLIGGLALSVLHPPWEVEMKHWTVSTPATIGFIILLGTFLAFYLYLSSLKYISPQESSLLGCTEPLVAVVSSLLWLHVPFGSFQVIGAICVIVMVILLSLKKKQARVRASDDAHIV
ncbi:drug/metabolite transporter (DMT)-like permease [Pullulanibacillus pueri]|uniref:Transporter n=1 Tax=Pullulanibacillus pueri TaxID=1437324 RepID=A0A8J3EKB8_9BACL|nr:DMT family transporter [Pullulanibacillus pueri]MBM7681048.1 drug/metabolite transporter (DMT)-like permease [Pullulanibacillus pueri]GGH76837.1 transporter [Pullulanibacillus pueri]